MKKKNCISKILSFSPVSLTPLINIHSQISPRICEKIRNDPNGILIAGGTLIYEKNLMSKISCQTPFKCTIQNKIFLHIFTVAVAGSVVGCCWRGVGPWGAGQGGGVSLYAWWGVGGGGGVGLG
jgi:hypothetical protein